MCNLNFSQTANESEGKNTNQTEEIQSLAWYWVNSLKPIQSLFKQAKDSNQSDYKEQMSKLHQNIKYKQYDGCRYTYFYDVSRPSTRNSGHGRVGFSSQGSPVRQPFTGTDIRPLYY